MLRSNLCEALRRGTSAVLVAGCLFTPLSVQATDSPLERLRQRSAEQRWTEIRDRWLLESPTSELGAPESFPAQNRVPASALPRDATTPAVPRPNPPTPITKGAAADPAPAPKPAGPLQRPPARVGSSITTAPVSPSIASEPSEAIQDTFPPTSEWKPYLPKGSETQEAFAPPKSAEPERIILEAQGTTIVSDEANFFDLPSEEEARPFPMGIPTRDAVPQPSLVRDVPEPYTNQSSGVLQLPSNKPAVPIPDPEVDQRAADLMVPPQPVIGADPIRVAQQPVPLVPPTPPVIDKTVFRPITEIEPFADYSPTGENPQEYLCPQPSDIPPGERARCPEVLPLPQTGSTERIFAQTHLHWQASNLSHDPLYFEDVSLERYGHTFPDAVQPFVSLGKFGAQLIGLPYQMALDPIWRDQYALGYYRPGDPAPYLHYQVPYNSKAALTASGVYTGLIFLIP